MTKFGLNLQTNSSIWTVKQVDFVLQFGLVNGGKVLANSLQNQMNKIYVNNHIYNEISSQLIVENKCLKYSFCIYKFCTFNTSNNLKAGATLYILQQKK